MGMTFGPMGALLPELFPANVRYTGSGISYNVSSILGAAVAPFIAVALWSAWRRQPVLGRRLSVGDGRADPDRAAARQGNQGRRHRRLTGFIEAMPGRRTLPPARLMSIAHPPALPSAGGRFPPRRGLPKTTAAPYLSLRRRPMKVGFIGIGQMGAGMAANLLKAGHTVTVYNRNPEKTKPLAGKGASVAAKPSEACHGDAVFTMLTDDEAVTSIVLGKEGIVESLAGGAVHISSSTISVALAERLAEAHARRGQLFVSAFSRFAHRGALRRRKSRGWSKASPKSAA